jgi:hypothetical protein
MIQQHISPVKDFLAEFSKIGKDLTQEVQYTKFSLWNGHAW